MAVAMKSMVIVPESSVDADMDRFWVRRGAIDAQVRLDGEDKVYVSYRDDNRRELESTTVAWDVFLKEFRGMLERLKPVT